MRMQEQHGRRTLPILPLDGELIDGLAARIGDAFDRSRGSRVSCGCLAAFRPETGPPYGGGGSWRLRCLGITYTES